MYYNPNAELIGTLLQIAKRGTGGNLTEHESRVVCTAIDALSRLMDGSHIISEGTERAIGEIMSS